MAHMILGAIAICGLWLFGFDLVEKALDVWEAFNPPKHFILQRVEYFNSKEKINLWQPRLKQLSNRS